MTALTIEFDCFDAPHPLKSAFLKWQCRLRQMAMRENAGRPDDGTIPELTLEGASEPLGHIITVLNKSQPFSATSELVHMAKKTNDPAQRREQAIRFFSAAYFQKHREFSDCLTSTFPPNSPGSEQIAKAGSCTLQFEAYAQQFTLVCQVARLEKGNSLFEATFAHNFLFNPGLSAEAIILGFKPDWSRSTSSPEILGGQ